MNDYFDGEGGTAVAKLESTTSVMVQMAQAELNQAVTTARAFPRSMKLAVDRITSLATLDSEAASECVYALPRGGKPIRGPSVRFAEIVGAMYGNCHIGSRIVAVDRSEKVVIAEGVFFDLETGMKRVAQVQRRISDKNGKLFNDDMIAVTGNAACSVAMREAVLKGVPKAIWRAAYEAAERVNFGKAETMVVRRGKAISVFGGFGVTPEQIFACLDVGGLDDIGLEEIATLTSMFLAIKNEEATVEAYFPQKVDPIAARRAASGTSRAVQGQMPKTAIEQARTEAAADSVAQRGTATKTEAVKPVVEPEPEKPAASDQTAGPVEVAKTEEVTVSGEAANPVRAAFYELVKGLKLAENINVANALWNDAADTLDRMEVEYPDLFAEVCDVYDTRANALTA